jgi:hypothetical protein
MVVNLHIKEVNNTENPANLLTIKSYPQSRFMGFSKESTSEMYISPQYIKLRENTDRVTYSLVIRL